MINDNLYDKCFLQFNGKVVNEIKLFLKRNNFAWLKKT